MKRLLAACAVFATLGAGAAFADTIENAFGNTITVSYPGGAVARYHFNADSSFTLITPDGQSIAGVWAKSGDQLCLTPAGGSQVCVDYVADKAVGDTWEQPGSDGTVISVALVAGR